MRHTIIAELVAAIAMLVLAVASHSQMSKQSRKLTKASEPPIQAGVYGFSGGRVPGADSPEGVIGECIWIFDQANKKQIAKGNCSERNPGKFRVVLKPGRYVVRGPGGNKPVEVKAGQWTSIESITLLPAGP